jgi:hypothetical protein
MNSTKDVLDRRALGLVAPAAEARPGAVFVEAGFSRSPRATETPLNLNLEARP